MHIEKKNPSGFIAVELPNNSQGDNYHSKVIVWLKLFISCAVLIVLELLIPLAFAMSLTVPLGECSYHLVHASDIPVSGGVALRIKSQREIG